MFEDDQVYGDTSCYDSNTVQKETRSLLNKLKKNESHRSIFKDPLDLLHGSSFGSTQYEQPKRERKKMILKKDTIKIHKTSQVQS